jgi:hypothetical protein
MSDITSVVAGSAFAGVSAITLQLLGVEPQSLVYGAIGAGIGTTAAPALGRIRAVFMFVCIVCLCAVAGTVLAQLYWGNSNVWRNLIAGSLAAIFHPLFSAVVVKIPEALDGAMRKVGLKQ